MIYKPEPEPGTEIFDPEPEPGSETVPTGTSAVLRNFTHPDFEAFEAAKETAEPTDA